MIKFQEMLFEAGQMVEADQREGDVLGEAGTKLLDFGLVTSAVTCYAFGTQRCGSAEEVFDSIESGAAEAVEKALAACSKR